MKKLLTRISKWNLRNLKKSESQQRKTTRTCSKCGEEKKLDAENYQPVKYFKDKYSFYCNICNAPKPKDND